jgi:NADH-quinone oxidoreductase subunit J
MTWGFLFFATLTLAGAIGAMSFRNLVHCALCLVPTFAGLAALFLQLNAEFVGFVQILVYVGAVAILIVFAILLTRGEEAPAPAAVTHSAWWGLWVAVVAFVVMAGAILSSVIFILMPVPKPAPTVRRIGDQLMQDYVLPLEVIGLLLTAALIGAVVIAMQEPKRNPSRP